MDLVERFTEAMPGTYLALVLVVAVACQWLAWTIRVPSLLLLLLAGFGLGQQWDPTEILGEDLLYAGVSIAVGVILFEGSLGLRVKELRGLGTTVRRLCTVTVLIAWPLITLAARLAGVEARLAVLVGALLVVTGPTVINPILRQLRPTRRVSALLRWEGIVVDPIGAVLATLVFQVIVARPDRRVADAAAALGLTILIGFGIGVGVGWVMATLKRRHAIPDFLEGVVFLSVAVGAFVCSNALRSESGLATVTVLGVFLANQSDIRLERVREFKEHLQVLFVGSLFVLLAGQVSAAELLDVLPAAAVFIGLLVVMARPLSIAVSLIRSDSTRTERTLLACMAPRGIVAAAVTSIFAREIDHRADELAVRAARATGEDAATLAARAEDLRAMADAGAELVPVVFLVVVVTVAIYGLGVGRLAARLGLATTSPQGVLMASTARWAIDAAVRLRELDVNVLLVSPDRFGVRQARQADVPVEFTHVLSEHARDELDLAGLGTFVAATPDDETNASAARELGHTFGSANTFQLARVPRSRDGAPSRRDAGDHLGRVAFDPPVSYDELRQRSEAGMTVRRTRLSREFPAEAFRARAGDEAVVMFVVDDGKVTVATEGMPLPARPVHVIAMVPRRDDAVTTA